MTAVYTAQTVSFQLRAEGCALMTVIEETNDAVGHAHLINSAHHYAKTITKPITIHNGRDWHILTVEPNGAVTCECCGNPIGYCTCAESLPPVSGGSPELDEPQHPANLFTVYTFTADGCHAAEPVTTDDYTKAQQLFLGAQHRMDTCPESGIAEVQLFDQTSDTARSIVYRDENYRCQNQLVADAAHAYYRGYLAAQEEARALDPCTIRTMYRALHAALSQPESYPAGVFGLDRQQRKGRHDAYARVMADRPTLLTLIRQLIAANRTSDAALKECDNHYQAGFDTGYEEEYFHESSRLGRAYYDASDQVDRIEGAIYERFRFDGMELDRARRIATKYA